MVGHNQFHHDWILLFIAAVALGDATGAINQAKFYAGGGRFENAQWNHFLTKIGDLCKAGS